MDTAWLAAGAGLTGALIGGGMQMLAGFFTDRRQERQRHRAWLRERRVDAFSNFIALATVLPSRASPEQLRNFMDLREQVVALLNDEDATTFMVSFNNFLAALDPMAHAFVADVVDEQQIHAMNAISEMRTALRPLLLIDE